MFLIFPKQLQSDEIVQLYDSSGIRTTKFTYNVSFTNNNQRTPSNYSVKLFKDIDVKSIKESTHLIGTGKDIFYSTIAGVSKQEDYGSLSYMSHTVLVGLLFDASVFYIYNVHCPAFAMYVLFFNN